MKIGGLQKFSMIDYPGKTCAIIFTVACNFRCGYCHNPELQTGQGCSIWEEEKFFEFLKSRRGKLDAVTITGGEPTLHFDLIDFMKKIKEMGFLVKLDSNGTDPKMLDKILTTKIKQRGKTSLLVDYVAMDIKGPLNKYSEIVGVTVNLESIKKSIELIIKKAPDYEFRTTIVKSQLAKDDFKKIGKLIKGAKNYYLQKFIPTKTLDQNFLKEETYTSKELQEFQEIIQKYVKFCGIR